MPRNSGPELRLDWIGTGSTGRDWQAGSVVSGLVDRLAMRKGGDRWRELCACHAATCGPWGEVRFGSTKGGGCLFGAAGAGAWSVRAVAFGDAGGSRFGLVGLGRLPRAAGGIGCQRAGGAFGHAERSVISGGICACHAATPLPFGVRCVLRSTESDGCLFGVAGAVRGAVHPVGGVWRCRGQRSADPETLSR
ncbi:hypothetical protein ABIE64_000366 [Thalassospira sp. MBR-102]